MFYAPWVKFKWLILHFGQKGARIIFTFIASQYETDAWIINDRFLEPLEEIQI